MFLMKVCNIQVPQSRKKNKAKGTLSNTARQNFEKVAQEGKAADRREGANPGYMGKQK